MEGAYYLFTPEEIRKALGDDAGRHFAECYDITEEGNFSKGRSVPNLLANDRWNLLPEGYGEYRDRLRQYRLTRSSLMTDTKILTGWNGLMLMALSKAGAVFDNGLYLAAARKLAGFLRARAFAAESVGSLRACVYEAGPRFEARLDDYVFYALGLIDLYEACFDEDCLALAVSLAEELPQRFGAEGGGYYLTARDTEALIKRPMETHDGALPSSNSAAAVLFDLLFRLTGQVKWRERREKQLDFICSQAGDYPAGCAFGLIALLSREYPTREIVCVADEAPEALKTVRARYAPELTVLLKRPDGGALSDLAPFTEDMGLLNGGPCLYVCSGGSCGLPVPIE